MKRIISALICLLLMISAVAMTTPFVQADIETHEPFSLSTIDFTKQIVAGFNFGNTFEAYTIWGKTSDEWPDPFTVNDFETGWGNPTTTQAMVDTYYNKGFNAMRLPVTWLRYIDDNDNYKIRDDILARIKEVAGYAQKNDMFVVVNLHHDDNNWLNLAASDANWEKIKQKYIRVWQQIAEMFKDCDEKLILEAANEPVYAGDWWGTAKGFSRMNDLTKVFVDTVRATGGNNAKRYLMIPTYGAQWYPNQCTNVIIPNNDDHVIVDVHWYDSDTSKHEGTMFEIYKSFIAKGQAAVFGECGMEAYNMPDTKVAWATSFVGTARKYQMPCFVWDDGGNFEVLDRVGLEWVSEKFVDAFVNVSKTTPPYVPATTTIRITKPGETTININNPTLATIKSEDMNNYIIPGSDFSVAYSGGWVSDGTSKRDGTDGSVILSSNSSEGYISQYQVYKDLKNIDKLIAYSKQIEDAMIAIDIKCSSFTTGDDAQANCLFKANWVKMGFNDDEYIKLTAGQTTTLYYSADYFTGTPGALWVQFNNYGNFGTGISTDAVFEISLPYIAYTAATEFVPTTAAPTTATTVTVSTMVTSAEPTTQKNDFMYGDCNNDKSVNAKDVLILRKHLAGISVEINMAAADANDDSDVNAKDVLIIRKYLAGYEILLGK